MSAAIIGIAFGLCLFILPLWAYRRGLKDGIAINRGERIQPIPTPVEAVQRHVDTRREQKESKEAEDIFSKGLQNILSYDGTPQEVTE